jgi:hypothetical protein
MTTRIHEIALPDFAAEVLAAVASGHPASFMRFNDGEAKFVGTTEFYPSSQIVQIIRRQFGDNVLNDRDIASLKQKAGDAVRNATIVGLPPIDWPQEFSFARNVVSGLIQDQLLRCTHVDFHQHLFASEFFVRLFASGRSIRLVTCRDVSSFLAETYNARIDRVYPVPEQADGTVHGDIRPHYPTYCEWLSGVLEATAQGNIFLVGAGICGKIYCDAIQRGGGIAIDVGSIFDLWAGRFSRPYMEPEGIRGYYFSKLSRLELSPRVIRACAEIHTVDRDFEAGLRMLTLGQQRYAHMPEFYLRYIGICLQFAQTAPAIQTANIISDGLSASELLLMGRLFKKHGLGEEAVAFFLTAFEREPFAIPVLTELCGYLVTKGKHAALKESEILRAAVLAVGSPQKSVSGLHQLLFQLARVRGARGDLATAVEYCGRAIEEFSLDINYFSHQIAWLGALGRAGEADVFATHMQRFLPDSGAQ